MLAAASYSKSGQKTSTTVKLDKNVFGVTPNDSELKHVYEAYLANGRKNSAMTKTRGLVSGGGKKPWRQKGTGRARFGSSRNPVWRGGGVAFGPTGSENYSRKITTNTKRNALRQALSYAQTEGRIKVLEDFESKDGKTSNTDKLLKKLDAVGCILLVVGEKNDLVRRATQNVSNLIVVSSTYVNVFDVLNADCVVVSKKSLEVLSEWLSGNENKKIKTKVAEAKS